MNKYFKYIFIIVCILMIAFSVRSCMDTIAYDNELTTQVTSPNGEVTLTLKYDYVSRPFLFHKDELIFSYEYSGFTETVFFEIEWLSEKEIRLYCEQFDEEYFISLE